MPATPEQRAAFGQELRAARQQRGMTMQQVVDALRPQDPQDGGAILLTPTETKESQG